METFFFGTDNENRPKKYENQILTNQLVSNTGNQMTESDHTYINHNRIIGQ